jgi:hypothetical protein
MAEREIEPQDDTRFFEHGQVNFAARDFPSRTAALDITMPCCLFQAVVPQLLAAGLIDHPRIHQPLSVWIPQVTTERMNLFGHTKAGADQVNVGIRALIQQVTTVFEKLAVYLMDPSDAIPMLPLGTYMDFRWRVRVDDVPKVLEGMQKQIHIAGVAEFQWALACVLQCVLEDYEHWDRLRQKALAQGT